MNLFVLISNGCLRGLVRLVPALAAFILTLHTAGCNLGVEKAQQEAEAEQYGGCDSARVVNSGQIEVQFTIPEGAQSVQVFRDGELVETVSDRENFTDTAELELGQTYSYTCHAIVGEEVNQGRDAVTIEFSNRIEAFNQFAGCTLVEQLSSSEAEITVPTSGFDKVSVYRNGRPFYKGLPVDGKVVDSGLQAGIKYSYTCEAHIGEHSHLNRDSSDIVLNPDVPPRFTFTEPNSVGNMVLKGDSFMVEWTVEDVDSNAEYSIYYARAAGPTPPSGDCAKQTAFQTGLFEDEDERSAVINTGPLQEGFYYFCTVIQDRSSRKPVWSKDPLIVNTAPTFEFTVLETEDSVIAESGSFNITWIDSDPDDNADIDLYYVGNNTGTCSVDGTPIPGAQDLKEDDVNEFNWTPGLTPGFYYICAVIADELHPAIEVWSENRLQLNERPSINVWTGAQQIIGEGGGGSAIIRWDDEDNDSDAEITFYYRPAGAGTSGDCDSNGGTKIDDLVANEDSSTDSITWINDFEAAFGSYYICARIDDGINPAFHNWESLNVVINIAANLTFTNPKDNDDAVQVGNAINVAWNVVDPGNAGNVSVNLYYHTDNTASCVSGIPIVAGLTPTANGAGSYNWTTTGGLKAGTYYVCALVHDDYASKRSVFSDSILFHRNGDCSWIGTADTNWNNSANWVDCGGGAPGAGDVVMVPPGRDFEPIITADTKIKGFSEGLGGGTITVDSGHTFMLEDRSGNTFSSLEMLSSATFKGSSSTCTDCYVQFLGTLDVLEGSVLSVRDGIRIGSSYINRPGLTDISTFVSFGNGGTSGGLNTSTAHSDPTLWPEWYAREYNSDTLLFSDPGTHAARLVFEGRTSDKADVSINGLRFMTTSPDSHLLDFANNFNLNSFSKLYIKGGGGEERASKIIFKNCNNSNTFVTAWNDIHLIPKDKDNWPALDNTITMTSHSTCSSVGSVTVSGPFTSWYGLETDHGNKIYWGYPSHTCVWNGSVSDEFTEPANWSDCNKASDDRPDYPDQLDWVIVPSEPINQPVMRDLGGGVSSFYTIRGFISDPGISGGGTLRFGDNTQIKLIKGDVRSDIRLEADDPTNCTDCELYGVFARYHMFGLFTGQYGAIRVRESATLTLGPGIAYRASYSPATDLYVGHSGSAGHLVVDGGADPTYWPKFIGIDNATVVAPSIYVKGVASEQSTVFVDGLNFPRMSMGANSGQRPIKFEQYYTLKNFDNVKFDFPGGTGLGRTINFTNCATGLIEDTNWDNLQFLRPYTTGNNIYMGTADCNVAMLPAPATEITITGSGSGYGAGDEVDVGSILDWIP